MNFAIISQYYAEACCRSHVVILDSWRSYAERPWIDRGGHLDVASSRLNRYQVDAAPPPLLFPPNLLSRDKFINYTHIKFHHISRGNSADTETIVIPQLFEKACAELGVEYVRHDVNTERLALLKSLGSNDLLYRSSLDQRSVLAERIMLSEACGNFYTNWTMGFNPRGCSYFLHEKIGLPVIPSVPFIPISAEGVVNAVEVLGGFPIIVKALGGSHGIGVMRVDSLQGFTSLLDFLRAGKTSVLLRKFIPHSYYSRMVVVGQEVVASHISYTMENEFRTNAGDDTHQKREAVVFPKEIRDIAVKAVSSLGLETGGVDVLFDVEGRPHIAEVNFPNNFSITQRVTGIDIAKAMVQHLMKKVDRGM